MFFISLKLASGQVYIREISSLKKRRYREPTSTDAEVSFAMSDMARVCLGDVAYYPFYGACIIFDTYPKLCASKVEPCINMLRLRRKGGRNQFCPILNSMGYNSHFLS